jgi:hypothetical protein
MTFLQWLSKLGILRWGGTAAVYRNARERPIELQDPGVLNAARDLVGGDTKSKEPTAHHSTSANKA